MNHDHIRRAVDNAIRDREFPITRVSVKAGDLQHLLIHHDGCKARAEKAEAKLARVSRAGVLSVLAELDRARAKFPTWPTDPLHALAVLGEEYGELTRAVLQRCYGDEGRAELVEAEAVQVAAMALRFLASLDEYEYREGSQHRDDGQEGGSDE